MPDQEYDVVMVGSGAAGAVAARILAERGVKLLVLEAGEWFDPSGYKGHLMPWELKSRGGGGPGGGGGGGGDEGGLSREQTGHIFARAEEFPFTTAGEDRVPYTEIRKVGGKTLLWTGHAWRFSAKDFKGKSNDGMGDDWPIGYPELKPYYDLADRFIGVSGSVENIPSLPDGVFLPPVKFRCGEKILAEGALKLGPQFRVVPCRKGIITKNYDGRAKCHWCNNCSLGCETWSKWSADITMKQALKHKNCELRTNAWVTEVVLNSSGDRVIGLKYRDGKTNAEQLARGRTIALAAGCIQTTRLLLNSTSKFFPNGLLNSSGVVGRNLMNHTRVMVNGYLRDLEGGPILDEDGAGGHGVIPVFYEDKPNPNFPRGYIINVSSGGRRGAGYAAQLPGFGADLKRRVKARFPAQVNLNTHGEMLPNKDTFIEIDSGAKDRFGAPGVKIHLHYTDYDRAMEKDSIEKLATIIEASNGVVNARRGIFVGGLHWSGTARMGDDPKASAVNRYCQGHEVKNLFLMDSSSWVSIAAENPTLTIAAVSAYAAHQMLDKAKKGEV